jgi:hypothetical protein
MKKKAQFYEQTGVAMTCRSYTEYVDMFSLEAEKLPELSPLLDVAGGASSFAAEACSLGCAAYAVDPMYALSPENILQSGQKEIEVSTAKLAGLSQQLVWDYYGDIERHRLNRERSLEKFIADYEKPDARQRYIMGTLPALPFADQTFGLVLCSHFLFLYHEQLDYTFHRDAVLELLRVCRSGGEVRIYPLYTLKWTPYPFMEKLLEDIADEAASVERVESRLPFIPGSEYLLRIVKK